jgi:hypothetical protein
MSGNKAASGDWADQAADELLYLLAVIRDERSAREILAAKLREIESGGAVRGAEQIAGAIANAPVGAI